MNEKQECRATLACNHRVAARDHRNTAQVLTDISLGLYNKNEYEAIRKQAWDLTEKALSFKPKTSNLYSKLRKCLPQNDMEGNDVNFHFYVASLHEACAFGILLGLIQVE